MAYKRILDSSFLGWSTWWPFQLFECVELLLGDQQLVSDTFSGQILTKVRLMDALAGNPQFFGNLRNSQIHILQVRLYQIG